jgi:ribulose-phosphate 3-epimerase
VNIRLAPSILAADFAALGDAVAAAERGGADLIHVDVMDGHFVPNLTFGPDVAAAVRRLTALPIDVHLMISEPARYVARFIDAGSDSITFHVEVDEPPSVKRDTLRQIAGARRMPGLAVSPATATRAVLPYLDDLSIIMVMTVEPGWGGQRFLTEQAPKIAEARKMLAGKPGARVHVDGGVSAETAAECGRYGIDVCVVGSALFQRGRDTALEVDAVRRAATSAQPAPAATRG